MSFLLDTNVLSEMRKPKPHPGVKRWLAQQQSSLGYISVVSLGEIRQGITRSTNPAQQALLEQWLTQHLMVGFHDRILPLDERVMDRWGVLTGTLMNQGTPIEPLDGLLAATALEYNLTLVTRNTKHFANALSKLLNPWEMA